MGETGDVEKEVRNDYTARSQKGQQEVFKPEVIEPTTRKPTTTEKPKTTRRTTTTQRTTTTSKQTTEKAVVEQPAGGLTADGFHCGIQTKKFASSRKVKPHSKYTADGKCQAKRGCEKCESEILASGKTTRRGTRDVALDQEANIFGGNMVIRGNVPWQINLVGPAGCGGTLVTMSKVVTAAHCVFGDEGPNHDPAQWKVKAGHINNNDWPWIKPETQLRTLDKLIVHPKYNGVTYVNDLAIMITSEPFEYTDYVRPACLPPVGFEQTDGRMIVSGLGYTETGWRNEMLYVTVPMCSRSGCAQNSVIKSYYKPELMICGGQQGQDSCSGDSGGPLVAEINGKFSLVGVVSFGFECGKENTPGVYVRVTKYLDWINATN